ncbi:cystathionine beta-synthase, partial [uncultured Salegentibacter sp.]|uniref:cystathionine beta-synthase n=1 Tax=uncultured Salegentibacter sp. TaxID=259320 RepID=UPI0030DAB7BD
MKEQKVLNYIEEVIKNVPNDWLKLTTHRLDIYNEKLAKTEFLEKFESLFAAKNAETSALKELPTAFDYIRLGHPLSSVLEWGIAKLNNLKPENIISFSSRTMPVLAVLRKNLFDNKNTQIVYTNSLPDFFDTEALKNVYGYNFELKQVKNAEEIYEFYGSTIFISQKDEIGKVDLNPNIDFWLNTYPNTGSILLLNGEENESYISEIQHVRRRESIAMTPADSFSALKQLVGKPSSKRNDIENNKASVITSIQKITGTNSNALLASCGLSMQYAIMMGLIDEAQEKHSGKAIKIVVPPNCYGGTNDQARRVAASLENVDIVDLPVDGDNDMVQSTDLVLEQVAKEDAVPYIIAEIPTNPRVEVPNLEKLREALSKKRKTASGETAIDPVFILDQTFCPNVQFLAEDGILS